MRIKKEFLAKFNESLAIMLDCPGSKSLRGGNINDRAFFMGGLIMKGLGQCWEVLGRADGISIY